MLQVHFDDERLRDLGTRENFADDQLGAADARALRALIAEAEAFPNAGELVGFRGEGAKMDDSLALPFGVGCTAHLRPVFPAEANGKDGSTDWSKVRRLMLTGIET